MESKGGLRGGGGGGVAWFCYGWKFFCFGFLSRVAACADFLGIEWGLFRDSRDRGWVWVGNSLLGVDRLLVVRRVRYSWSMFVEDCSFLSVFFAFMKRVGEVEVFLYHLKFALYNVFLSFSFVFQMCVLNFFTFLLNWYYSKKKKIEICRRTLQYFNNKSIRSVDNILFYLIIIALCFNGAFDAL